MCKEATPTSDVAIKPICIPDDIRLLEEVGALENLLRDRSTEGSIIWATEGYAFQGEQHEAVRPITLEQITGGNNQNIRKRAQKAKDEKSALTRQHAEVFTPTWICRYMIDEADAAWSDDMGYGGHANDWQKYVESPRLEITCGEAPYLVNRYDAETGEPVAVADRIGMLDRKLRLVTENVKTRQTWMKWAKRALQSIYGYEYQGDNLLIARVNCLMAMHEHLIDAGYSDLSEEEWQELASIVSWNLWQMDGLSKCVPFGKPKPESVQASLFDDMFQEQEEDDGRSYAVMKNWQSDEVFEFKSVSRKGKQMKFDYIIGNPPYQEDVENEGDRPNPIYDKFMTGAYEIADVVELIHPARFLFDAGQTPKAWNKKMLADPHLKVLLYEADGSKIFSGTDIKGGIAVTIRDVNKEHGAIGTFTAYPALNSVREKVVAIEGENAFLDSIVTAQGLYRFSETLFAEHPEVSRLAGKGTGNKIVSNLLDKLPGVFFDNESSDEPMVKLIGLVNRARGHKYIARKYLEENPYIDGFSVLLPEANGSGAIGEVLSTPLIGAPLIGSTDSFLSIGLFDNQAEAEALLKYVKTKFARGMLGILKVTQHNGRSTWKYVPLQDFTSSSDIDWSQSVAEIDVQLYKKYGLSDEEIDFIETHVKEME